MVDESIVKIIRRYLDVLNDNGIHAEKAILFGSHARGQAREYSDIDILVLSEDFDRDRWGRNEDLWRLTIQAGYGLQPIPVGIRQFIDDDESTIIEVARREGVEISRN